MGSDRAQTHPFGHGIEQVAAARGGGVQSPPPLRARQRLGKYRIVRRIAEGGFARVYEAVDTVEGVRVALKIPRADLVSKQTLESFRREVRTHCTFDHPNVVPIKNADFVGGRFVVAVPLGEGTLSQRLKKRVGVQAGLDYARQILEAVAHVHSHRIAHCDVKPDNFLLFPGNRLRLADFGIAKLALRTLRGSGSGTLGYMAPEQAMGRPSLRADVFAVGLLLWRVLAGELPEWPFEWPLPGLARLRRRLPAPAIEVLRRALDVEPRRRFADAGRFLAAWNAALKGARPGRSRRDRGGRGREEQEPSRSWQEIRFRQFRRAYGAVLRLDRACGACGGPLSEAMGTCPWCSVPVDTAAAGTSFPATCPRCGRGRKKDWKYCAWCWGAGFEDVAPRARPDRRYEGDCSRCHGALLPFARYCVWCRARIARPWRITGTDGRCRSCGWGVVVGEWQSCPWCGARVAGSSPSRGPSRRRS
ncbi:MAG: protein kinase [Planctomycetes bacterium]|nr:protein kinase [Planctomycetota bacterium]